MEIFNRVKTLWKSKEKEKQPDPVKVLPNNPLQVQKGDYIEVNQFGKEAVTYEIQDVSKYVRRLNDESYVFTNYKLSDTIILRVYHEQRQFVLLAIAYDDQYSQDLEHAAKSKEFYEDRADGKRLTYKELGSGYDGYRASYQSDTTGKSGVIKYWDFYRDPDPTIGELDHHTVYLFVDIDERDGWTNILIGPEIEEKDILALRRDEKS